MLLESSSLLYHAGDEKKNRKSDIVRDILLIIANFFSKHVE